MPGLPLTMEAKRCATLVSLAPDAALSHGTALNLHGLSTWGEPEGLVHAVVHAPRTDKPPSFTVRHRSRQLRGVDVTTVDGLRLTTAARTLLDVAPNLSTWSLEAKMLHARQRRLLEADDLRAQLLRRPTVRGATRFREALAVMGGQSVDSILEHRTLALLEAHDVPRPVAQYPLRWEGQLVVIDLAYPTHRVAVECDGVAYHGDDAVQRDRDRWGLIQDAGWNIIWVTWKDLHEAPERVVGKVRRDLARAV